MSMSDRIDAFMARFSELVNDMDDALDVDFGGEDDQATEE